MNARTIVLGIAAGLVLGVLGLMAVGAIFVIARSSEADGATRAVHDFRQVSFSGMGDLYITQGNEESLTIEASPQVLRRIRTEVSGDTLYISVRSGWFNLFRPFGKIRFDLTVRELSGLDMSGAGNTYVGRLETEELNVDISGAGNLHIDELNSEHVDVHLSGAGSVEMAGQVAEQDIELSGVGSVRAGDLAGETVEIDLSGAGSATVWAREQLDVSISGAGSVSHYGSPQVHQETSGIGSVRSLGEH